jgi:serine kinase of HPr protein (carbohydrate metabolism regulator)
MNVSPPNHHGTAVLLGETGVLIRGKARSGKSALALSLLRRAEILGLRARLVSDDQVLLRAEDGRLLARPPASIAGRMEISGVGIFPEDFVEEAEIHLLLNLEPASYVERLPEKNAEELLGVVLPRITLPERQAALATDILHSLALRPDRPSALTKS